MSLNVASNLAHTIWGTDTSIHNTTSNCAVPVHCSVEVYFLFERQGYGSTVATETERERALFHSLPNSPNSLTFKPEPNGFQDLIASFWCPRWVQDTKNLGQFQQFSQALHQKYIGPKSNHCLYGMVLLHLVGLPIILIYLFHAFDYHEKETSHIFQRYNSKDKRILLSFPPSPFNLFYDRMLNISLNIHILFNKWNIEITLSCRSIARD